MSTRVPFRRAIAPVLARYASLIDAAAQWCGACDRPADPDLFGLVCAGAAGRKDDQDPLYWTRIGVRALLRCGLPDWISLNGCATWPLEVVPATWLWLDFLHDTGRMNPASDPLWELRKPLICYGGLGFDGRWRAEGDPSPIPCECYLPYRATAEHLHARLAAGTLGEGDLFRGERPVTERGALARPVRGARPSRRARRVVTRPPDRGGRRPRGRRAP